MAAPAEFVVVSILTANGTLPVLMKLTTCVRITDVPMVPVLAVRFVTVALPLTVANPAPLTVPLNVALLMVAVPVTVRFVACNNATGLELVDVASFILLAS